MLHILPFIQFALTPMLGAVNVMAPGIAEAGGHAASAADYTAAAFAASSAVIAFICIYWACWAHVRLSNIKIEQRQGEARSSAALAYNRALVENSLVGVIMMRTATEEREYLGAGRELFDRVLDSAQAPLAIRAMDALNEDGRRFALTIRDGLGQLVLRGVPVGGRAVIYISEQHMDQDNRGYMDLLDALPDPVWLRDGDGKLGWANRAYWLATGGTEEAHAADAPDWSGHDLVGAVRDSGQPATARRDGQTHGQHRTYMIDVSPCGDGYLGIAHDITAQAEEEAASHAALDTQIDLLDRLGLAVAMFGENRRLVHSNQAFASLWGLSQAWLDKSPSHEEILDHLREKRRLPEQRSFADWKLAQVSAEDSEEVWHLPGGRSVAVTVKRHLQGGVFIQYEDISERLRLASALSMMTQVQKATLDTIDDGIAIFGTDGKLILHNGLFASMWQLTAEELAGQPHFAELADLCGRRIGRDGIWGIVACGINSATPERFGEWGKALRADGRFISLSLSRLPNGATVIAFSDITDLERFSEMTRQNTINQSGQIMPMHDGAHVAA